MIPRGETESNGAGIGTPGSVQSTGPAGDPMAIKLSKEAEQRSIGSIKRYCAENIEEADVGDLKATLLLDFFIQEIGPTIYNQAIRDAQAHIQERVVDLDSSCYQLEFGYWSKQEQG